MTNNNPGPWHTHAHNVIFTALSNLGIIPLMMMGGMSQNVLLLSIMYIWAHTHYAHHIKKNGK